jgi:uncharacterized OB-fold protein
MTGTVYTETVVFSPTEAYVNDIPYQLAIIQFETGKKTTARIVGERVAIGDRVALKETRDEVQYFEKQS